MRSFVEFLQRVLVKLCQRLFFTPVPHYCQVSFRADLQSCEQSLFGPYVELFRDVFFIQQSFHNGPCRIAFAHWVGALTMAMQAYPDLTLQLQGFVLLHAGVKGVCSRLCLAMPSCIVLPYRVFEALE